MRPAGLRMSFSLRYVPTRQASLPMHGKIRRQIYTYLPLKYSARNRMSRFFVPRESIKGNAILISGPEAHHMLDVMRLKKGEEVTAFDGEGKEYKGVIKEIKEKTLAVEI